MAKKNFLYPADWVKTKPYMAVDSVDIYYTGIANRIYDILKETKLDAIFNTPHSMRTAVMSITGWFEDVISQNGIWQAFTNECEQMYGKKLPFYPLGDNYYPDEINQEDIQFLLWHNLQTVTRTQRIINPTSPVLMLAAEFIYHMLEDEYETAPENERLHQFIYASVDKEVACAHYVEVATWFHYKSFINIENFDEFMTVNGEFMQNAQDDPQQLEAVSWGMYVTMMLKGHRSLLVLTTPEWLSCQGQRRPETVERRQGAQGKLLPRGEPCRRRAHPQRPRRRRHHNGESREPRLPDQRFRCRHHHRDLRVCQV